MDEKHFEKDKTLSRDRRLTLQHTQVFSLYKVVLSLH